MGDAANGGAGITVPPRDWLQFRAGIPEPDDRTRYADDSDSVRGDIDHAEAFKGPFQMLDVLLGLFKTLSLVHLVVGPDSRVSNGINTSGDPSLVWSFSSNMYGVAWVDMRNGNEEVYFARLSLAGVKMGSDVRLTMDPNSSRFI